MKKLVIESLFPSIPAALARPRMFSKICTMSLFSIRLGTSEVLRMLLMSSTKYSCAICVSLKRNTVRLFASPASFITFFRSSCHSCLP